MAQAGYAGHNGVDGGVTEGIVWERVGEAREKMYGCGVYVEIYHTILGCIIPRSTGPGLFVSQIFVSCYA